VHYSVKPLLKDFPRKESVSLYEGPSTKKEEANFLLY